MQVAIALALGMVGIVFLLVVVGMTPFLAIPIGVLLLLSPWLIGVLATVFERRGRDARGVPSTREASYEPVVDPAERQ